MPLDERLFSWNLNDWIARGCALDPAKIAIRYIADGDPDGEAVAISYRQLQARSNQAANLFRSLGVSPTDVVLYVLPSPIYVLGVKAIADTSAPNAEQLGYLAVTVLVMLWIIELPMLGLLAFPKRGPSVLAGINGWIARHWRSVAMMIALVLGAYLIAVGLVELLS